MRIEIERKFLIDNDKVPNLDVMANKIIQGYISTPEDSKETRLRQSELGYFLTIKSTETFKRVEYEVALSKDQFDDLWELTENRIIVKERFTLLENGASIDLDLYKNELQSLIMAEVEFDTIEEAESFKIPSWFGQEVTDNHNYDNRCLATNGLETIRN